VTTAHEYLTTSEVADIIRRSREYVARQCAVGTLKGTKLGDEWRIHRDDLHRFMAGDTVPTDRPHRRRRAS
jgi:excisionase family DNA binding protein